MNCPRCNQSNSYELNFRFKAQDIDLTARVCRVCEFIFADEKDQLKAVQKHLHWLSQQNV